MYCFARRFISLPFSLLGLLLFSASLAKAGAQDLPPEVAKAFQRANIPLSAVGLLVAPAEPKSNALLSLNASTPMNPASVMKLVTSYAVLDILGPAYVWKTPVYVDGKINAGVLTGNVYIKGAGNPKLVVEDMWILLRRLRGLGIEKIQGDVLIDKSAFDVLYQNPGDFDGEPSKPYNVQPDALLTNFNSLVLYFNPQAGANLASVHVEPEMDGVQVQATVPLSGGSCGQWREGLKATIQSDSQIRFTGSYPRACGEGVWGFAYSDPYKYAPRVVAGMWQRLGGSITGKVTTGAVPSAVLTNGPAFYHFSSSLAEIVRFVNKFSNNVMARHLFLSLALHKNQVATLDASRQMVQNWWQEKLPNEPTPVIDNGSGLSLNERITPNALAAMLKSAWASPVMPEFLSSLPIAGVDGTLRKAKINNSGSAHIKTGTMPKTGISAMGGYVDAAGGKRYVLVAIVNHPNAAAARPALEALIDWTADQK